MNGEEKVYFGEKIESKETDLEKVARKMTPLFEPMLAEGSR